MDAGRSGVWLILAWAWLLAVVGYMSWGVVTESGLYFRLTEWQVARYGAYYPKLTAAIPMLVLGAPALWYIRRHNLMTGMADRAQGPAAVARRSVRNAQIMALAGCVMLAVGGGAYALSLSVPADGGPAVPLDVAALGRGPMPTGRVKIVGRIDPGATAGVTETTWYRETAELYVGFRGDGETDKDAPFRLFVERTAFDPAVAATAQVFLPEQEGHLEENGLPSLAREELARLGVRVAEPHYVLHTGSSEPRAPYYIAAALGGLVGAAFLVVGLITLVQARRRLRRAMAG